MLYRTVRPAVSEGGRRDWLEGRRNFDGWRNWLAAGGAGGFASGNHCTRLDCCTHNFDVQRILILTIVTSSSPPPSIYIYSLWVGEARLLGNDDMSHKFRITSLLVGLTAWLAGWVVPESCTQTEHQATVRPATV